MKAAEPGRGTSPPACGAPCAVLSWGSAVLDRHLGGGRDGWAPLGQPGGLRPHHARTLCFLGGRRICRESGATEGSRQVWELLTSEASARARQDVMGLSLLASIDEPHFLNLLSPALALEQTPGAGSQGPSSGSSQGSPKGREKTHPWKAAGRNDSGYGCSQGSDRCWLGRSSLTTCLGLPVTKGCGASSAKSSCHPATLEASAH